MNMKKACAVFVPILMILLLMACPDPLNDPSDDQSNDQYALTVTVSPQGGGTVTVSPAASAYAPGTEVSLRALPAQGYLFTRWEGNLSGTANPATLVMNANKAVTAVFSPLTVEGGNVVKALSLSGAVSTVAGVPGYGSHFDGSGVGALLSSPCKGVRVDDSIYFCDGGNHMIRRFRMADATVTRFSGTGEAGYQEGAADQAQFNGPWGIATDGTWLYVVDNGNHVIRRVSFVDGSTSLLAGGPAVAGSANGSASEARFNNPNGITFHGGFLYVADHGNNQIRRVNTSTGDVSLFAGSEQGDWGSADGTGSAATFYFPHDIATDGTSLFVTDHGNHTIRKILISSGAVSTIAGSAGSSGWTDSVGAAARFNTPYGCLYDSGKLYISEYNNCTTRVLDLSTMGVTTLAGSGGQADVKDGTHTAARFHHPLILGLSDGILYVGDVHGHTLRSINLATRLVTTVAGSAYNPGNWDGKGVGALLNTPTCLTTDGRYVYFTEEGTHVIRKLDPSSGVVSTLAGSYRQSGFVDNVGSAARFRNPTGITTDGTNLYVADSGNQVIRKIVIATGEVSTLAGAQEAGLVDGTGTDARFNAPMGITTDGANLYVVEYNNHAVRKIVIATRAVITLAGNGETGAVDGTGSAARFQYPLGINSDGSNLYVTDYGNQTIRKIAIATGAVTTLAGTAGVSGYVNDTGQYARFFYPHHLACDGMNLWVTELGNHTVRKIVIATGVVTGVAGSPPNAGWMDGSGTAARFNNPDGICSDGTGLFIADHDGHVIRRVE